MQYIAFVIYRDTKRSTMVPTPTFCFHLFGPDLIWKKVSVDRLSSTFQVTYKELLMVLFDRMDPTQLNRYILAKWLIQYKPGFYWNFIPCRQGNDRGTQYRSGIYYHSEEQKVLLISIRHQLIFPPSRRLLPKTSSRRCSRSTRIRLWLRWI